MHADAVDRKREEIANAQQGLESRRLGPQIPGRSHKRRLHHSALELRNARRAASRCHIVDVLARIELEVRRRQSRKNIDQRAVRADRDFFPFQIGELLNARVRHDHVVGPLDQNTGHFERQSAQIGGDDGLKDQIVVDVSGGKRCHRDVGVHLQNLDIQAFIFEVALKFRDAAAQERHVRIGNRDIDRFRVYARSTCKNKYRNDHDRLQNEFPFLHG